MCQISAALLRTLAFHASWGYAPTRLQLVLSLDIGPDSTNTINLDIDGVLSKISELVDRGLLVERHARLAFAEYAHQIDTGRQLEEYFPRKLRRARKVSAYLRRIPGVRAVCLCNTVALGQSNDSSDLDFFIISQAGTVWRTRFLSALPFKILGLRPGKRATDPVCLSFFVGDNALDLSKLSLVPDDPYFRHWFLSLLPLFDDGILADLWRANTELLTRHPLAKPWIALDHSCLTSVAGCQVNAQTGTKSVGPEYFWRSLQEKYFPSDIKTLANLDTRVVVTDDILKFHVTDHRAKFRTRYNQICHDLDVEP